MPTQTQLDQLVINKVESKEVYDYMVSHGLTKENEMYLVKGTDRYTLGLTGDVTGSASFDGSGDVQVETTIEAITTAEIDAMFV